MWRSQGIKIRPIQLRGVCERWTGVGLREITLWGGLLERWTKKWVRSWRKVGSIAFSFNGRCNGMFICWSYNLVKRQKLIMQERFRKRIVIWKPMKELLKLFRLFSPGLPSPVGIFITLLWFSPVKLLHQVPLVVSVPSLALVFPLLLSIIPLLRAQH